MPSYISLFTYTGDAWHDMVKTPADRAEAARAVIADAGGHMTAFHWMLGPYDGLVIYTMPNEVAASAFSAAVSTSGLIARLETHQLLDSGQAMDALAMAHELRRSYRPPGASENWRAEYDSMVA